MELKKVHKQDRVRKPQEPYPTSERCRPPLWPPTQCTCIPSSLCCSHTTKWTRDASALRWRPERGPASFLSGVGFLRLSNPVLFVYFFQLHPYSKWSFFRNFFPLVEGRRDSEVSDTGEIVSGAWFGTTQSGIYGTCLRVLIVALNCE